MTAVNLEQSVCAGRAVGWGLEGSWMRWGGTASAGAQDFRGKTASGLASQTGLGQSGRLDGIHIHRRGAGGALLGGVTVVGGDVTGDGLASSEKP